LRQNRLAEPRRVADRLARGYLKLCAAKGLDHAADRGVEIASPGAGLLCAKRLAQDIPRLALKALAAPCSPRRQPGLQRIVDIGNGYARHCGASPCAPAAILTRSLPPFKSSHVNLSHRAARRAVPLDGLTFGKPTPYSPAFSNRKGRAIFVPPPHGKNRHVLTAVPAIFFPYDVLTAFLLKGRKTRIRREKCTPKILVNGSNLARVKHKTKPWVERRGFRNRGKAEALARFRN
jgi:hypothetical protein